MLFPIVTGFVLVAVLDTLFSAWAGPPQKKKKRKWPWKQWIALVLLIVFDAADPSWYRALLIGAVLALNANLEIRLIMWRAVLALILSIYIKSVGTSTSLDLYPVFTFVCSKFFML